MNPGESRDTKMEEKCTKGDSEMSNQTWFTLEIYPGSTVSSSCPRKTDSSLSLPEMSLGEESFFICSGSRWEWWEAHSFINKWNISAPLWFWLAGTSKKFSCFGGGEVLFALFRLSMVQCRVRFSCLYVHCRQELRGSCILYHGSCFL